VGKQALKNLMNSKPPKSRESDSLGLPLSFWMILESYFIVPLFSHLLIRLKNQAYRYSINIRHSGMLQLAPGSLQESSSKFSGILQDSH
jgi:hypothetical protein